MPTARRCAGRFTEIKPRLVPLARRALARRRQELADWRSSSSFGAPAQTQLKQAHLKEKSMFDHISIGVRDIAATRRFYDAALKPLGLSLPQRRRNLARLWPRCRRPVDLGDRPPGCGGSAIGPAFLLRRAGRPQRRGFPRSGPCGRRQGEWPARPAHRLRPGLFRRLCRRPRRLPAGSLLLGKARLSHRHR